MNITSEHNRDLLFGSIVGFNQLCISWVNIIIDKEMFSPALRRNAISIWLYALIEFMSKTELRNSAINELNSINSSINIISIIIRDLEQVSHDLLSKFTQEEQILIWQIRNRAVHGHLSLHFHDDLRIQVYCSNNREVTKIKKTRIELSQCLENSMNPTPTERILNTNSFINLTNSCKDMFSTISIERYYNVLYAKPFKSA